jgi:GT2 family glycosyltransferase
MPDAPEVSAVVVTRNRAERLRALLASLAAQRDVRHEVIVVDDGSTDETPALLAEAAERHGVRVLREPGGAGLAAVRNTGWRAARAPLVAFVDDDCVAEPGWLRALVDAHRADPDAIVQGHTEPHPAERHRESAFSRSQLVTGPNDFFQTCNIAYPRALLERVGGFDPAFTGSGEDTDLAWRARAAGAPARFEPRARVTHAVHGFGALALARAARRWEDVALLVKRHPGLRQGYPLRIFWKPAHGLLAAAIAGVLLAARTRGASLAAVLPYVHYHRRAHGSYPGTIASLPAHVLVDGAEVLAVARGSLRHRTVVL